MNTKEAIEFCKEHKVEVSSLLGKSKSSLDIIPLLKRGEKYEKIVRVIEDELGEYALTIHTPTKHFPLRYASTYEDRRNLIKIFIKEIKQKYFPKAKELTGVK